MNPTKLVRLSLALVTTLILAGVVRGDYVNYTISGRTGDSWSGQFQVSSLTEQVLNNTFAVTAVSGYNTFAVTGGGYGNDGFFGWNGSAGQSMQFQSQALYNALYYEQAWTWGSLIGNHYVINSDGSDLNYLTRFIDPNNGNNAVGYGGQIEFLSGGSGSSSAVPEPSSFAMLAIGGLVLGGYAWRKKKQTA